MAQYNFTSPLANFSDAIAQELLRREMQKRQDMLDALRQKQADADIADRKEGRALQLRQQDLSEKLRTDALTQRQQEHDDALAAVAPPEPGLTGNIPSQFAQPMDTPSDMGGLSITAPTAGGSAYQAERRKAGDALAQEQARLTAASQDKADQRDFQAQQNEMSRAQQLIVAHLMASKNADSQALADRLKAVDLETKQDKLDTGRQDRAAKATSAEQERSTVYGLAQELLNDPTLDASTGMFRTAIWHASQGRDYENRVNQLKALLSLENRQKLKGQGAISDAETAMLANSATALDLNTTPDLVRRHLRTILEQTAPKNAPSDSDVLGSLFKDINRRNK